MATIVYQGLQSCLQEPQFVEPRTIRLKLSSPISHNLFSATPLELGYKSFHSSESNHIKELSHNEEKCHHEKPVSKNSDLGGWSFIQSFSNTSCFQQQNPPAAPVYNKRSSGIKLNDKSLELCTEDLGSETGTIFIENNIFESEGNSVEKRDHHKKQTKSLGGKKLGNVHNFPPPLTTISGSQSFQYRPHREDGRLIIEAVKTPTIRTCFQAERSDGRLRLCFAKDYFGPNYDSELRTTEAPQEEDTEANSDEDRENEGCDENERNTEGQEKQVVGDIVEVVLEEKHDHQGVCFIEELDGNSFYVGGEGGIMDKFERPRRCKEGGEHEKKGLLNFEPCNWVATS